MIKKNRLTGLRWSWLAFFVFVFDLLSKVWVLSSFRLYDSIEILPFFHFTYVRNYGAAFSTFWGQRWVLALIAVVVGIVLIVLLHRSKFTSYLNNIGLSLILGGAIGNLFDRVYHGFVVDFIDVYLFQWRYPTFNIADSAICIGAVCLVCSCFFVKKEMSS